MTVNELIAALSLVDNKDQTVEIALYQNNKVYPVAYMNIADSQSFDGHVHFNQAWDKLRIRARLPETDSDFMITATRKK
jgi:hypothetical protein